MPGKEIVVGVSGASGALLARRFVETALKARGLSRLHLVFSEAALEVARGELDAGISSSAEWIGGLAANGQRAFPNATLHADKAESDFWLSQAKRRSPTSGCRRPTSTRHPTR